MEIKRYRINFENWKCITEKRFTQKRVDDDTFNGYAGLVEIDAVEQRQEWEVSGEKIAVCDKNNIWLTFIPDHKNCVITAMMAADRKILLWYIDIMENLGMGKEGILEYDDLFLDFIVMPDGAVYEEDRDELMEAYGEKVLSCEQLELTERAAGNLRREGYLDPEMLARLTVHLINRFGNK